MKRESIQPGALQTNSAFSKTSDKSDKTSFEGSSDSVLSLLSSIFGIRERRSTGEVRPGKAMPTRCKNSTEWQHGGKGPLLAPGSTGPAVDSAATDDNQCHERR